MNESDKKKLAVKAARASFKEKLSAIATAESAVADMYKEASPSIEALVKASGSNGPHRFGEKLLNFRKVGDHYSIKTTDLAAVQDD